jgi:hypothetical protein
MAPAPTPENVRNYDLFLRTTSSRLFGRDRGISLTDTSIAWSIDGVADEAPLGKIVEVRLQSGGAPTKPTAMCQIRFADGNELTVNNNRSIGTDEHVQDSLYRNFVHDLHRCLRKMQASPTRFVAGYPERKYWIMLALVVALGIIAIAGPMVVLLIRPEFKLLGVLFAGGIFIWPYATMVQANAPRSYDPRFIPAEVLP